MERPLDEEAARAAVKAAFEAVTADDVRVNIDGSERAFLRYAVNEVTTSGQVTDAQTSVTCAVGAKHATVTIHGVRPADVAAAAKRALELARVAPDDPEYVPSPGAATMKPVPAAWSDAPVTPDDRAALVADAHRRGEEAEADRLRLRAQRAHDRGGGDAARLLRHPLRHRLRRDDDGAHAERRRQRLGLRRRGGVQGRRPGGGGARGVRQGAALARLPSRSIRASIRWCSSRRRWRASWR